VQAAIAVARQRAIRLQQLRTCLQDKRTSDALLVAATLCGLKEASDEASNTAGARKH
jgi:hypothetical protein